MVGGDLIHSLLYKCFEEYGKLAPRHPLTRCQIDFDLIDNLIHSPETFARILQ